MSDETQQAARPREKSPTWAEISRRVRSLSRTGFGTYFWLIIVVVSTCGLWIPMAVPLLRGESLPAGWALESRVSVSTYIIAVLAAAATDTVVLGGKRTDRDLGMVVLAIAFLGALMAFFHAIAELPMVLIVTSLVGIVACWAVWVVANAVNTAFDEPSEPGAALGDQSTLAGNTAGYKV